LIDRMIWCSRDLSNYLLILLAELGDARS